MKLSKYSQLGLIVLVATVLVFVYARSLLPSGVSFGDEYGGGDLLNSFLYILLAPFVLFLIALIVGVLRHRRGKHKIGWVVMGGGLIASIILLYMIYLSFAKGW